jgi:hypothetical protein
MLALYWMSLETAIEIGMRSFDPRVQDKAARLKMIDRAT